MRPIRLAALFPGHLNLNGDVANREVLAAYLGWQGFTVELVDLESASEAEKSDPDFVVIGHGSIAAWKQISPAFKEFKTVIETWLSRQVLVLAISTGRDALMNAEAGNAGYLPTIGILDSTCEHGPSRSVFAIAHHAQVADGAEILGYLNSSVTAPLLDRVGSLYLSSLHGPVLSRNLEWLHELAAQLVQRAGGQLKPLEEALKNEETAKFGDLVEMIRKLELELARE